MPQATHPPIQQYLEKLYARLKPLDEGKVATYIPELALADPRRFGICIATVDGHVYEIGDTWHEFTIQSISKAITYGLALEDSGVAVVLARWTSSLPARPSIRSACTR